MELMEVILSKENLNRAYKKVVANKGASGIDKITTEELGSYIRKNKDTNIEQFFDKVNHDKLIQILREQVNDSDVLNLIRK